LRYLTSPLPHLAQPSDAAAILASVQLKVTTSKHSGMFPGYVGYDFVHCGPLVVLREKLFDAPHDFGGLYLQDCSDPDHSSSVC
jgi:hypothetical protein